MLVHLKELQYLDISNNRYLGLCGLKNITIGLNYTNISVLKANNLHCEDGISLTLFCDNIEPLSKTALQELHLEGNTIANGQYGLGFYLPKSLKVLKLGNNRWVVGTYAYSDPPMGGPRVFDHLTNLNYVDISNMNANQFS